MTLPITTVPAWTGFLALPPSERDTFLAAASAYTIAAAAMQTDFVAAVPPVPVVAPTLSARPSPPPMIEVSATRSPAIMPPPTGSSLPLIGGAALDLAPRAAFAKPDFIRRWRPGRIIHCYVASTCGLAPIMRPLEQGAYSVGIDSEGAEDDIEPRKVGTACDLSARMARHNRLGHASVSKADPQVRAPGFTSWMAEPMPVAMLDASPMSPVAVRGNSLEIVLPISMTPDAFDRKLAGALAGASLAGWAMSAAGRAICKARGVDPWSLVRGTPGADGTVTWCTEIVLVKVTRQAVRLLRICEQIILDHMAAEPSMTGPTGRAADARPLSGKPPAGRQAQPRRPAPATAVGTKRPGGAGATRSAHQRSAKQK